jgi:mRNA interferase MazF
MLEIDQSRPPKIKPLLVGAPKIRQIYWCDFPLDAQLPEFWKRRPVIIVSFRNTLNGTVTVIPCSSQDQRGNIWAVRLNTTIDGSDSWAVCDKITSVAVSRLSVDRSGLARLNEIEFNQLLVLIERWLPKAK